MLQTNKKESLYNLASVKKIPIDRNCPEELIAMSVKFPNGKMVISMLSSFDAAEEDQRLPYTELECLAHELGHCMTDSFYAGCSPFDVRIKHEHRANKWAIRQIMPFDELCEAVKSGHRELWQLAEYFDVSTKFVEKAIAFHSSHGNVVPRECYAD